jgi:hypothetical protein
VGHAYIAETMLAQQDETLEEAFWSPSRPERRMSVSPIVCFIKRISVVTAG